MKNDISKLIFGILIALAVVGSLLLHLFRPDASATFISQVIQLAGLATVGLGLGSQVGKIAAKQEVIEKATNGANTFLREALATTGQEFRDKLTEKDAEIARLQAEAIALAKQVPPTTGVIETHDGRGDFR